MFSNRSFSYAGQVENLLLGIHYLLLKPISALNVYDLRTLEELYSVASMQYRMPFG